MNTLFTALDAVFAIAPGIGGEGVAARASHETLALAWDAMPAPIRREVAKTVAEQMGWTIAKAKPVVARSRWRKTSREQTNVTFQQGALKREKTRITWAPPTGCVTRSGTRM